MAMPPKEVMGKGEKVVVIWDEKDQIGILVELLKAVGYVANGFFCGEDALKHLRGQSVDLLLVDIDSGKRRGGLEICKRARKLRPDQKAMLMSGYGVIGLGRAGVKSGIDRVITKAFSIDCLAREIREVLGERSVCEGAQTGVEELQDIERHSLSAQVVKAT